MSLQYYRNQLELVTLDDGTMQQVLYKLQGAVKRATGILKEKVPGSLPENTIAPGTIYSGILGSSWSSTLPIGVALMFLRLEQQASYVEDDDEILHLASEFHELACSRLSYSVPEDIPLRPGRLSPLGSASLGASVLRVFAGLARPTRQKVPSHDIIMLQRTTEFAIKQGTTVGGDEALYGRAGVLLALLQIRQQCKDDGNTAAFTAAFTMIPRLATVIIETGKVGASDYNDLYGGQDALSLMWPWHGKYYLGAIHGITGILSILLACKPDELNDGTINHLPIIAETISGLCKLTIENAGNLPSSVPIRSSSLHDPYVQICHGSPGLLILLAQAENNIHLMHSFWEPDWDKAIRLGSEQVWERGFEYGKERIALARRSFKERTGSVASVEEQLTPDYFLSRALTLLLYARKTPPFHRREFRDECEFRMPDTPYSLFEGLAGTCAAWGEACVMMAVLPGVATTV
ncbi:lanthionine synthetase C family protein [Histoplasma capsulatum]|uniref:Lanthionine synthetase C family protein n=1 Tax=Ajellomyces capsulatus TaxID=5037 RepID=A0A8A1M6T2_AJECA|nr:lanthionine synthetase C family protein [Histoplasma capsulatum]